MLPWAHPAPALPQYVRKPVHLLAHSTACSHAQFHHCVALGHTNAGAQPPLRHATPRTHGVPVIAKEILARIPVHRRVVEEETSAPVTDSIIVVLPLGHGGRPSKANSHPPQIYPRRCRGVKAVYADPRVRWLEVDRPVGLFIRTHLGRLSRRKVPCGWVGRPATRCPRAYLGTSDVRTRNSALGIVAARCEIDFPRRES
jgi:hypothetical protein